MKKTDYSEICKQKFECASKEEIDAHRLKAYMSFGENPDEPVKASYLNSHGEVKTGVIIRRRSEDEILVKLENNTVICLSEKDLL
jgi:hypothetical protein